MDDLQELSGIAARVASARTFDETVETLVDWAQELTGCDAAMLRLLEPQDRAGAWIPALVQRGHGDRFLQDEGLIGAEECLCGRVCSGLGHPELPFYTRGGSFVWGRVQSIGAEFPPESLGIVRGRCILEGYESVAIIPLFSGGRPVGSLHLADSAPEKFSDTTDILEAVCRACGPLLMRHEEAEREPALLRAVEAALLPRTLPYLDGLDLGVAFTSATRVARVGGDFYDVLEPEGGGVLLYVGDCTGSGLEVAGRAARVRHAVSELAAAHPDPADLLARADVRLRGLLDEERPVTMVACHLRADGTLRSAVAGHPRPLRLGRGGGATEISLASNVPLGLGGDAPYVGRSVPFGRDDTLLLYTDGVTDSRRGGRYFGVDGVCETWRGTHAYPLAAFAQELCERSARFHDDRLHADDRLVLAARLRG